MIGCARAYLLRNCSAVAWVSNLNSLYLDGCNRTVSLRARINHLHCTCGIFCFVRQLSVERDSLRNSLEKEAAKSKRLSLENEELQWRLVNSSSPLASPSDGSFSLSTPNRRSLHLSTSPPDFDVIREMDK